MSAVIDKHVFFHAMLFYCSFTFTPSQCTEFNLKIEYNETINKITADNSDTATNRVDEITNGKLHLESNSEAKPNILNETKQGYVNTDSNVTFEEFNRKPFVKSNAGDMKLKLNNFTMVKRGYYYPTPSFEYPKRNREANDLRYRHFKDNNYLRLHNDFVRDLENYNHNDLNKDVSQHYKSNNNENENGSFEYSSSYINKINKDNQGILNLFSHPEMTQILKKQTELIEDLENYLRLEKNPLRSDFDDLLNSVEIKKNKTENQTAIPERITDTTKATLPTATAVIDETAVRTALRKDPFVQRILKMANRKKELYMKHAKKYYNNLVYN